MDVSSWYIMNMQTTYDILHATFCIYRAAMLLLDSLLLIALYATAQQHDPSLQVCYGLYSIVYASLLQQYHTLAWPALPYLIYSTFYYADIGEEGRRRRRDSVCGLYYYACVCLLDDASCRLQDGILILPCLLNYSVPTCTMEDITT